MFGDTHLLRWKAATRAAQHAYDSGDFPAAARLFQDAAEEAEQLLLQRCEDLPTPRMYVATCQSLAESYRRLGYPELARTILQSARQRLLRTAADDCLPATLRQRCLEELRHALATSPSAAEAAPQPSFTPCWARLCAGSSR